jgi:hypothetical protein
MSLSITEKLLCSSRLAYTITGTGPVAVDDDGIAAGFNGQPSGFVAGDDQIDAGLVGESDDGIVVAFRGTLPPSSPNQGQMILDWVDDIDAVFVVDALGLPGQVHQGFLTALNDLWTGMNGVIMALTSEKPTRPIYVTGHSKGGAMAYLAALRLRKKLPDETPIYVATFAAARAGDQDFATAYNAALPHSARYEYADDIVPHLPPSDLFKAMFETVPFLADKLQELHVGYASAGELHYIDWSGALVPDSPVLRFERSTHLANLMVTLGFKTIAADHSIDSGSGYADGVAAPG